MFTLLSQSTPKARKPYVCEWCGEAIEVGTTHVLYSGTMDGHWQDTRMHAECYASMPSALNADDEFEPRTFSRGCGCERGWCECGKNNSGDAARKE
jgi:hypothetical protein